ncbi:MAG: carboxypeptidase regulatory-like domain-containing protein, partial [Acidobacteria bacterium]|nr:carboxypeptidase regulatory-like domain-containing protein [Acidobacteriota bacterium]
MGHIGTKSPSTCCGLPSGGSLRRYGLTGAARSTISTDGDGVISADSWGSRMKTSRQRTCVPSRLAGLAVTMLLIAALAQPAAAQVLYGSIIGTVTDPTGAVVPNATVSITSKATGASRETSCDAAGRYSLLNVVAGSYDLQVT